MIVRSLLIVLFCLFTTSASGEVVNQIVAGAGPSTRVIKLFFNAFSELPSATGYSFLVPLKSVKHSGGIENSDKYLFGRTGRPLDSSELALNKGEIHLAMVPTVIVGGAGVMIPSLSMSELERIYQKKITQWKKVGGPDQPIITVGREETEAIFSEIKKYYFFFRKASFDKTFKSDNEVVNFLRSPEGRYAIAFGAAPNFEGMNILSIKEGLQIGVRVGLVYDLKNRDHALVKAVQEYALGEEWRKVIKQAQLGFDPLPLPDR